MQHRFAYIAGKASYLQFTGKFLLLLLQSAVTVAAPRKSSFMAYSEKLADRIRKRLAGLSNVEEKKMIGGLTFMYNGKMCVGVMKDELMCRIDPSLHEMEVARKGCRTMDFNKRAKASKKKKAS